MFCLTDTSLYIYICKFKSSCWQNLIQGDYIHSADSYHPVIDITPFCLNQLSRCFPLPLYLRIETESISEDVLCKMLDGRQCAVSTHNCNIPPCIQNYSWQLQYIVINTNNHNCTILPHIQIINGNCNILSQIYTNITVI